MKKTRIAAGLLAAALMVGPVLTCPAVAVNAPERRVTMSASTTSTLTVTVDGLNIRKSSTANSSITGSLDKGATIRVTQTKKDERGNTWGKLDSGKGWVNLKYTTTAKSSDNGGTSSETYSVKVTCDLNVRSGPGTGNSVVSTLKKGTTVKVDQGKKDKNGNNWGRLADGSGWINLKYVTKTGGSDSGNSGNGGTSVVSYTAKTTIDLNVRKGAGTSYSVVKNIPKGTTVTIVAEQKASNGNTWGKLSDGSGWISLKYATKTNNNNSGNNGNQSTSYNVKVNIDLNVRKGVGSGTSIVKTLDKGTTVTIVAEQKAGNGSTWGKLSDGSGWINLKYATKTNGNNSGNSGNSGNQSSSVSYTVKVNCDLNVRKSAGSSSALVTTLGKGATVTITAEQKDSRGNTWGKLSNGSGWINLKYATKSGNAAQEPTEQPTQKNTGKQNTSTSYSAKAISDVNIRSDASGESSVTGVLKEGEKVTIVEVVSFNGRAVWGKLSDGRGWVSLKYTEKS